MAASRILLTFGLEHVQRYSVKLAAGVYFQHDRRRYETQFFLDSCTEASVKVEISRPVFDCVKLRIFLEQEHCRVGRAVVQLNAQTVPFDTELVAGRLQKQLKKVRCGSRVFFAESSCLKVEHRVGKTVGIALKVKINGFACVSDPPTCHQNANHGCCFHKRRALKDATLRSGRVDQSPLCSDGLVDGGDLHNLRLKAQKNEYFFATAQLTRHGRKSDFDFVEIASSRFFRAQFVGRQRLEETLKLFFDARTSHCLQTLENTRHRQIVKRLYVKSQQRKIESSSILDLIVAECDNTSSSGSRCRRSPSCALGRRDAGAHRGRRILGKREKARSSSMNQRLRTGNANGNFLLIGF